MHELRVRQAKLSSVFAILVANHLLILHWVMRQVVASEDIQGFGHEREPLPGWRRLLGQRQRRGGHPEADGSCQEACGTERGRQGQKKAKARCGLVPLGDQSRASQAFQPKKGVLSACLEGS